MLFIRIVRLSLKSAEIVLNTALGSINGLRNTFSGAAADSAFEELVDKIADIQNARGLGLRVEERIDGTDVIVVMPTGPEGTPLNAERRRVRELLQLADTVNEFQVEFRLLRQNNNKVAMTSRSMLEIMLQIGFGIDLPPAHIAEGRVLPGQWQKGEALAKPLAHIRSGLVEPKDAYVSVEYKDYWYWIEDTDLPSKRLFTFLMILFSLAETGQTSSVPVVTVPSR
jgi:hypothetical protein